MESTAVSTWSDYRRRSRLFWGVLLLGLAVALAIASLFLIERLGLHGLAWPLLGWVALVLATGLHWQAFRCPRCRRRFFRRHPPLLALRGNQCVNCMLPKD